MYTCMYKHEFAKCHRILLKSVQWVFTEYEEFLPEPVPCDAGWPEPVPCDAGWPEPVPCDADWPEPVPCDAGWPEPVPCDAGWHYRGREI